MATFTVNNADDSGAGSLRDAIALANKTPGNDRIRFDSQLKGKEIVLTSGELQITDSVKIKGFFDADELKISGNSNSRIFNVDDSNTQERINVVFKRLTLTDGSSDTGGGAIANSEDLQVVDSKIINNENASLEPTGGGGAIRNSDTGKLTIDRTLIADNQSSAFGGGITNFGELAVRYSRISGNQVTGGGGAGIDNRGSRADITGSFITNNTNTVGPAGGFGNGTPETTTTVKNSVIFGNKSLNGAGFFVNAGRVEITNTVVAKNQAQNNGGGAGIAAAGNLSVKNSLIFGNSAVTDGGGIFNEGGSLDAETSAIFSNSPNDIVEI